MFFNNSCMHAHLTLKNKTNDQKMISKEKINVTSEYLKSEKDKKSIFCANKKKTFCRHTWQILINLEIIFHLLSLSR